MDDVTEKIIGAAIEVHRVLGPGLLESIYDEALCHEFELRDIEYKRQVAVDVEYKGKLITGQRMDLIVGALKNQVQHFSEGMLHEKNYSKLSIEERTMIQTRLEMGVKPAVIAPGLNRSASTLSRELKLATQPIPRAPLALQDGVRHDAPCRPPVRCRPQWTLRKNNFR